MILVSSPSDCAKVCRRARDNNKNSRVKRPRIGTNSLAVRYVKLFVGYETTGVGAILDCEIGAVFAKRLIVVKTPGMYR